jgi:hypothetical protein
MNEMFVLLLLFVAVIMFAKSTFRCTTRVHLGVYRYHTCMQKVRVPQLLYYVAAVGVEIQEARDQRPETRDQRSA